MCSSHARHKDWCHRDLTEFTEICPLYSVILLSALALKKHGAMFYSLIHKFREIGFPGAAMQTEETLFCLCLRESLCPMLRV